MAAKLGAADVSFRLGATTPAAVYLGAVEAWSAATVPGAPTAVVGTAGDSEVLVEWTAPASDGGSVLTDYLVQYSDDDGETWATFSDGSSTTAAATVTGLTNGVPYVFRVAAVNAVGSGAYSAASDAVTPAVPGPPAALLLNFNGANESTTFTDSSVNGLTVTAAGDAKISTAESKFGGASLYLDGDGDFLLVDGDSQLDASTGDFTIEMWAYLDDQPNASPAIYGNTESYTGNVLAILWDGGYGADQVVVEAGVTLLNSASLSYGWHHIAVVRESGDLNLYVDGELESTAEHDVSMDLAQGGNLVIGRHWDGAVSEFQGYIDDFRIVIGTAVYTGAFTPPASQLGPNA